MYRGIVVSFSWEKSPVEVFSTSREAGCMSRAPCNVTCSLRAYSNVSSRAAVFTLRQVLEVYAPQTALKFFYHRWCRSLLLSAADYQNLSQIRTVYFMWTCVLTVPSKATGSAGLHWIMAPLKCVLHAGKIWVEASTSNMTASFITDRGVILLDVRSQP